MLFFTFIWNSHLDNHRFVQFVNAEAKLENQLTRDQDCVRAVINKRFKSYRKGGGRPIDGALPELAPLRVPVLG
jgi:hypothetical protein